MKLFDAVLDLARDNQGLETYRITSADNERMFMCSELAGRLGQFGNGGTCFFIDGEAAGQFCSVSANSSQGIRLEHSVPGFAVGDRVGLSGFRYFDTQHLVGAVNHVLYTYPIMKQYVTNNEEGSISYSHRTVRYAIPAEVSRDIRRVEIETACLPRRIHDEYVICHYWEVDGNDLVIDRKWIYREGAKIKIRYVDHHDPVYEPESEIDPIVDRDYLRKMASLYLWTNEIQTTHKDDVIAVEMFNQAKQYEDTLRKKNIPENNLLQKDVTYFW